MRGPPAGALEIELLQVQPNRREHKWDARGPERCELTRVNNGMKKNSEQMGDVESTRVGVFIARDDRLQPRRVERGTCAFRVNDVPTRSGLCIGSNDEERTH